MLRRRLSKLDTRLFLVVVQQEALRYLALEHRIEYAAFGVNLQESR